MRKVGFWLVFLGSFALAFNAMAKQSFSSGEKAVSVVELFTSEGCSSCPPADRWLSGLTQDSGLWNSFIPMAFHVDYWDYIGWKDPYASRANSQRQRRYAAEYRERTVYTPGLRLNGEEWRAWRRGGDLGPSANEAVGVLSIDMNDDYSFEASFNTVTDNSGSSNTDSSNTDTSTDETSNAPVQLNVAILGMGLSQNVTRGENSGRTLKHDFVVLETSAFASAEAGKWSGKLPRPRVTAEQYAVVAWVSPNGRQSPLQATGGLLD